LDYFKCAVCAQAGDHLLFAEHPHKNKNKYPKVLQRNP